MADNKKISKKLAQRQVLAKITELDPTTTTVGGTVNFDWTKGATYSGYFAQVSGGEVTASVERIYVGGEKFPEILCAPAEIGDITLTAHYDEDMVSTLSSWRRTVGRTFYQIEIYQTNCDLGSAQSFRSYPKCLLVGLTEPEGDASSGAPATFTLTFAVSGEPTSLPTTPTTTPK